MRTRKSLCSSHRRLADGVLIVCVIVLGHLVNNCQCQRPITNMSVSQPMEIGAATQQIRQEYLLDNNVLRSGGGSGNGRNNGGNGWNRGRLAAATDTLATPVPPSLSGYGQNVDYVEGWDSGDGRDPRDRVDESGSVDGLPPHAGRDYSHNPPIFDINYAAQSVNQQQQQPNRDRKHTFQDLRKNLKDQRKQWDRQGDEPEQNNQNLVKIIRTKIMKSDVSINKQNIFLSCLSLLFHRLYLFQVLYSISLYEKLLRKCAI